MNCQLCGLDFMYTSYIRVMRRNEKTHRSKQTWIPVGRTCVNCGANVNTLEEPMRRDIINRRTSKDKQLKLKLNEVAE